MVGELPTAEYSDASRDLLRSAHRRSAMPTVLIVDDHAAVRKALRDYFEGLNLAECREAVNGQDAIQKAKQLNPDLVVLDFSMPEMNGFEAARALKQLIPGVPVFMLTAYFGACTDLLAKESGVSAAFSKDDVTPMIHRARAVLHHAGRN
jgi:CheY-like chemotaxis protein